MPFGLNLLSLIIGILLGIFVYPMVKGKIGSAA